MIDYTTEAIPERDPAYELPGDCEESGEAILTLSLADAAHWTEMVRRRPVLRCLRGEYAPT